MTTRPDCARRAIRWPGAMHRRNVHSGPGHRSGLRSRDRVRGRGPHLSALRPGRHAHSAPSKRHRRPSAPILTPEFVLCAPLAAAAEDDISELRFAYRSPSKTIRKTQSSHIAPSCLPPQPVGVANATTYLGRRQSASRGDDRSLWPRPWRGNTPRVLRHFRGRPASSMRLPDTPICGGQHSRLMSSFCQHFHYAVVRKIRRVLQIRFVTPRLRSDAPTRRNILKRCCRTFGLGTLP